MRTAIATPALAGYAKLLRHMSKDVRMNVTHVSLLTGLFVHWQRSGFNSPFAVTRKELMAYSKIASIAIIISVSGNWMLMATLATNHLTIQRSAARFTGLPTGKS